MAPIPRVEMLEITSEIALNPMVEVSKWCKSLHRCPQPYGGNGGTKGKLFRVDPHTNGGIVEIVKMVNITSGTPPNLL